MILILAGEEPVKHPYYIDVLGIHIHSPRSRAISYTTTRFW